MFSVKKILHAGMSPRTRLTSVERFYLRLSSRARNAPIVRVSRYSTAHKFKVGEHANLKGDLHPRVEAIKEKLIYSDYVESKMLKLGYQRNKMIEFAIKRQERKERTHRLMNEPALSVALKYFRNEEDHEPPTAEPATAESTDSPHEEELANPVNMPYSYTDKFDTVEEDLENYETRNKNGVPSLLNEKYKILYEKYLEIKKHASEQDDESDSAQIDLGEFLASEKGCVRLADDPSRVPSNWMTDYEQYNDGLRVDPSRSNYGTPLPNSAVSHVPCGGCGALLHCKDPAIPGYLPSEIFSGSGKEDLMGMICQRCHFMKYYNVSLGVNVSPEEYPELLRKIKGKKVAVILMVDLLDFPCSIWPDIMTIIGHYTPVFVVGNKIDLLPPDSPKFLEHVEDCLTRSLVEAGVGKANIKHVALVSAKTGYGIEELINKLHKFWEYKGDVYLVGCTNVGKSSLFNMLLQSDLCKVQAADTAQRATISPWPGTTLNLLKFPILNPLPWRLYLRTLRLVSEKPQNRDREWQKNDRLRKTQKLEHATLEGHVGRTFTVGKVASRDGTFAQFRSNNRGTKGLDDTEDYYEKSRWCYDTPGTIQPDQVLHLLTTEELTLTMPDRIIPPRTFLFKPGQTLFLAGLGRLDYVEGEPFMRCTVFANENLPIAMCRTTDADLVYRELLQTEAFVVPVNEPERLKLWPELASKEFTVTGINLKESAADVVLSSAGWIALTPDEQQEIRIRAWTPEGRGIYLRTPALLNKSVNFRGARIKNNPAYKRGWQAYARP